MADLTADDINKRLRAIQNLRVAGAGGDRLAQLEAEAQFLTGKLNDMNAIAKSFGGDVVRDTSRDVYNSGPEMNQATILGGKSKEVEAKKKRFAELQNKGALATPEEQAEMTRITEWLNQ